MLPLSPSFLRTLRGVTWQHSRKKLGERAGVRGRFLESCNPRKPLIRPIGHLLPPKGERTSFHTENQQQNTTSVNLSRQTWHCPARPNRKGLRLNLRIHASLLCFEPFAKDIRSEASALSTIKRGVVAQKRGQEPTVRSTLRAIWLLVPDPFSEP